MDNNDLLACFLEDQETFSDTNIANNLLTFIFAGVETSQYAAQTIVSILTQKRRILEKARKEFDDTIRKPAVAEGTISASSLSTLKVLESILTLESVTELEYANMIM